MKTREVAIEEIFDLMKSGGSVAIEFLYGGYLHEIGVREVDGHRFYYFNEDEYPSMLSFKCSACIEDIALAEIRDKVQLIVEK